MGDGPPGSTQPTCVALRNCSLRYSYTHRRFCGQQQAALGWPDLMGTLPHPMWCFACHSPSTVCTPSRERHAKAPRVCMHTPARGRPTVLLLQSSSWPPRDPPARHAKAGALYPSLPLRSLSSSYPAPDVHRFSSWATSPQYLRVYLTRHCCPAHAPLTHPSPTPCHGQHGEQGPPAA